MKSFLSNNRLLLVSVASCVISLSSMAQGRQELSGDWQFRQVGAVAWSAGCVPGCVHTDLMALGELQDPYYGRNEKDVQWVGEKDWEYRRVFSVSAETLAQTHCELVMEGVDTYADVFVNGQRVLVCDNAFRTWRTDIKSYLAEGENEIKVCFSSIFKVDMPKYLAAPYKLQAWPNNDQADIWLSLYARKPGYNYGWDWGPRLITTGLWKPVYLEAWSELRLASAYVKTESLQGAKAASMRAEMDLEADMEGPVTLDITCEGKKLASKVVSLSESSNKVALDFVVKKPRLWWTNGLGDQPLYDFTITVRAGHSVAAKTVTTGIRTLTVDRSADEHGHRMAVILNGKPVFCKGADWIPLDNFPARITPEWYAAAVGDAAAANMNMLRVWGGGLYESDDFYHACDSLGIMVWQDMAFACGMFPSDAHYLESVAAEVKDNVTRIRQHPSLALWCGNNENSISYYGWGWRDKTPQQYREQYEKSLHHLFEELIPQAIAEVDDAHYYHPTSPVTGFNGIGGGEGDSHFWSVWKGGMVDEYLKPRNIARFMSEYGFQALPCEKTIDSFTQPWDRKIDSAVMLAHQKAHDDETRDPNFGNNQIIKYMKAYYDVPSDFYDFVFLSQYQQAEAVKVAIEAHRRAKPYCMGTLYWQINDCWPVASWSSIDYYGRWKALHYYAKKAYSEMLASPYLREDGSVAVKVVSDRQSPAKVLLRTQVMSFDGRVLFDDSRSLQLAADSCEDALTIDMKALEDCDRFVYVTLTEGSETVSTNIFFEKDAKYYNRPSADTSSADASLGSSADASLRPSADVSLRLEDDGHRLTLCSDRLVRGLHLRTAIDTRLSDDYVTLVPGVPVEIISEKALNESDIQMVAILSDLTKS